ncbi:FeoB-associated Cys-rich membrane protein [Alysiella crassa]|uniref:Virus attachment protein p12 family n=1 Tax=Alysiella crassa TaxID=153491 RepID=A0A376BWF0_9NEIS|nr:FeoB-associated Cys-rich membrane protein [Alysiella crassa]UOP06200.1 FeoB-associated Cys-rich membrane protein [Alysiella crassa]SSY80674.1 Virus attachment protein p12 family [Alysiella crassa]
MGIQEWIVLGMVAVSVGFVLRKYVFKPKNKQGGKSCSSGGCGKCGGCG